MVPHNMQPGTQRQVVSTMFRPLYFQESLVPILQEGGCASKAGLDSTENRTPPGFVHSTVWLAAIHYTKVYHKFQKNSYDTNKNP